MHFTHTINGRIYSSEDVEGEEIKTLADYKRIVRRAYGNLRGVRFETHGAPCTCGNIGRFPCEASCPNRQNAR